ncbi:hypothetical protein [Macrococcus brunensis]|nr:hypothetical protein [Macrococcus brunensis]ULG71230.1 hypothetical protein MGG12_07725 [Macrococcus brunensis]
MEYLAGGRDDIFKKDNKVLRPVRKWTPDVHKFLLYMAEKVDFLPIPYE